MPKSTPPKTTTEEIAVPYTRVTSLVRQLTHDVRNGLNNVDLQSAYLQEIATDPQGAAEIKRLRGMVAEAAKMLRDFSARFWLPTPNFVTYSADMFLEDFRGRLGKSLPQESPEIRWTVRIGKESVSIDIEMFSRALLEFFKNAFQFREPGRPIEARVQVEDGRLVIELTEGKTSVPSDPETWGREPLVSTRRGGFGMGLFYAHQVFGTHEGEIIVDFDSAAEQLSTRLSVPLAAA